jgi:hypothetical protein
MAGQWSMARRAYPWRDRSIWRFRTGPRECFG